MKNTDYKTRFQLFRAELKWIFFPKIWIGQKVNYYGKNRLIISETFNSIMLEGIDHPINKRNYPKLNG